MNDNPADVSVIIVAAGNAARMGGTDKQLLLLDGLPVIAHSFILFDSIEQISEIILVTKPEHILRMKTICAEYISNRHYQVVAGGSTRQDSVFAGIAACNPENSFVAIHDGARPLVRREDVLQVLKDARHFGAATLGVPSKDTVKLADSQGFISTTPNRDQVYLIQTPQVFQRKLYLKGIQKAAAEGKNFTDDCQLVENTGTKVFITCGHYDNVKITTPEDYPIAAVLLSQQKGSQKNMRIGHGYDVHKLVENRKLILGGVEIPHSLGLLGHSDADVLIHAIMDALLGAAAMGDIGKHFPDTDPAYRGADSTELLCQATEKLRHAGYRIENIDSTVIAQKPKLAPYLEKMRKRIADVCKIQLSQINIKATTEERLGFTGRQEGISAHAVALICKI